MLANSNEHTTQGDLFRARLDQIINTKHELVQLAGKIDWAWIDAEIAPLYSDKGRPGIESRFVIGLLLLKHMFRLSDEGVCERWVYDPYFQYFTQRLTGREIERVYVDKGYRGHDAPRPRSVFISGQKRGVFGAIKRELRRRSAVEPLIGHMKEQGHLGRCHLKGHAGDAANAILTAAGYKFRRILAWLRRFLSLILAALIIAPKHQHVLNPAS